MNKGALDEIVIEPGRGLRNYWRDLWTYRELFYFLAWRDVAVRYKQTVIGVAWSVIRPILTMVVFTVIFGRWAQLPSDGVPYPVMVFSAMLPWQFFSSALGESSNSLIANANLITKVYFPRLAIPMASVMVSLVDFLISMVILVFLMLLFQVAFTWRLLLLPVLTLLTFAVSLGGGLWMASLTVKYRDFRYVVPFLLQLGMYISPVGFSTSIVPPALIPLYALNPMVGIIDGFRWAITGAAFPGWTLVVSIVITLLLLVGGVWYFRQTERGFADVI
jgi:lipopolysaccharide transport system permease protein